MTSQVEAKRGLSHVGYTNQVSRRGSGHLGKYCNLGAVQWVFCDGMMTDGPRKWQTSNPERGHPSQNQRYLAAAINRDHVNGSSINIDRNKLITATEASKTTTATEAEIHEIG